MSEQVRASNTFAPEDGAELALSMILFTFINRDKTVCYGELFVGYPKAERLDGAPEYVEWLYRLPEFHEMLEELPVVEVNADVYHHYLIGDYSKRRGAKKAEMAWIVDDEFPNNELDISVCGDVQGIVIYPGMNKPPKPEDYPLSGTPEDEDDESGLEEDQAANGQEDS